ncbi:uncharacterized protein LOC113771297 [Coffea eugenioides]|uniref:uncharacterized protein LOC113771297 n=1 Tax=Coffea eugenioides TaxID=49369 RepID=UPI000F6112D5|nr:uncharacterized protein LOC113771297 [Coffea eugenioides]
MAIQNMSPPRNLREVQRLNGRLAALNRFLSQSAEKALPFFKVLKKADQFAWTEEYQAAFDKLKQHLHHLPTLVSLRPEEKLYLYLSAADEAVNAMLIRNEGTQVPVYYVSRALRGPETRYTQVEKLVLGLVHAARRLKPYFLAHSIFVRTDQPIRQILVRPEASGRLTKWAVELGEYDLSYEPRTAIKAQALADFLAELTFAEGRESTSAVVEVSTSPSWMLYVDGSSNGDGSGAGLLLESPQGEMCSYALRFGFLAINNEAEYEALIAGLQLACRLGAQRIHVRSDSQLVLCQILGEYEAKDETMQRYLSKVHQLTAYFKSFEIQRIPRSQNRLADALSQLASTSFSDLNKTVLVEVLSEPGLKRKPGFKKGKRTHSICSVRIGDDGDGYPMRLWQFGELETSAAVAAQIIHGRGADGEAVDERLWSRPFPSCFWPEALLDGGLLLLPLFPFNSRSISNTRSVSPIDSLLEPSNPLTTVADGPSLMSRNPNLVGVFHGQIFNADPLSTKTLGNSFPLQRTDIYKALLCSIPSTVRSSSKKVI